jgi:hypothetical protein
MLQIEELKKEEKLLLEIRRHWIVYIMIGIYACVGLIISTMMFAVF